MKFPETIITLRHRAANRINLYEFINQEISDTLINAYNKVNICTISNPNDANIIFDDEPGVECKKEKVDYDNNIFLFNSEDEEEDENDDSI